MNIAILSFYSGVIERGVEVWAKELAKRLVSKHTVTIYQAGSIKNPFEKQIPIDVEWSKGDRSHAITSKIYGDYWSRKIYSFTKKALNFIDPKTVDIIIPTNGGWQSILTKQYVQRYKKKMIIVGHSGIGLDDYVNLLSGPDVFVALTYFQKQWASKKRASVKTTVIPDGIDTDTFSVTGVKEHIKLDGPIFLTASSLSEYKRVDLAIKAVSKLNKGSLIVLGQGDKKQASAIKSLGSSLLGKRFLLRSVSHTEIPKWYRACDVFTFPSYAHEAFGMVILEAMSCNKPVVANSDPIRREIVGEGGLLCNPLDIEKYSSELNNALKTNFGNKPREQAERFDWSNIVAQYNKLFNSI